MEKQILYFFWMQNRPNMGVYIVCTLSKNFALALEIG